MVIKKQKKKKVEFILDFTFFLKITTPNIKTNIALISGNRVVILIN